MHISCYPKVYAFFLFIGLFAGLNSQIHADDAALYDPTVAADESLVRVLNFTTKPVVITLTEVSKKIPRTDVFAFSDYIRVKQGTVSVDSGSASNSFNLNAGDYYTVVVKPDGQFQLIEDRAITKKGKALLSFYNFTNQPSLDLKTADGKVEIIKAVAAQTSGFRQINAVSIKMAIYAGGTELKALPKLILQRDQVMNIAIIETNGQYVIKTTPSRSNTRI